MTSRIGSKKQGSGFRGQGSVKRRLYAERCTLNAEKGFTLIEVMAATAVLVAGVVFIYEAFFISLDSFGYCYDCLNIAPWIDEKVWQIQDDIKRYGFLASIDKRGSVTKRNRNFYWNVSCNLIGEVPDLDLYKIDLSLSWQVGSKKLRLSRTAYATYVYEEEE